MTALKKGRELEPPDGARADRAARATVGRSAAAPRRGGAGRAGDAALERTRQRAALRSADSERARRARRSEALTQRRTTRHAPRRQLRKRLLSAPAALSAAAHALAASGSSSTGGRRQAARSLLALGQVTRDGASERHHCATERCTPRLNLRAPHWRDTHKKNSQPGRPRPRRLLGDLVEVVRASARRVDRGRPGVGLRRQRRRRGAD